VDHAHELLNRVFELDGIVDYQAELCLTVVNWSSGYAILD
jgi:hypothetical protein